LCSHFSYFFGILSLFLSEMSLARKILSNTASQVAGRFATAFLAVVVVKILTVYLGQSGYGQYATIYEFLAFFGAFADFGIFTIAVREMSRKGADEQIIFGNTLTLRTLFTASAMLLAAGAAFLIPQYQNTVIPLGVAIAALSTFFVILSGTLSAALQIKLRMEIAAFALVIGKVFTVLFILLLTQKIYPEASQESFYALIWAGSLGAGVTFLLTAIFTRRIFPIRFRFDAKQAKKIIIEAAPFAIALALHTFYIRMDILLLSLLLPASDQGVCSSRFCSDTEVGVYAVGARILEILIMVPIYFMNSVLPSLTRAITGSSATLNRLLKNAFSFLLAVGLPAGILLFVLARETAGIISSEEFLSSASGPGSDTALQILAILVPLAFCSMFFGFLMIAAGKQKTLIWINLMTVLFNLILDIWAIPHFGFVGAATASVLSECVMLILMIFFSRRIVSFEFPFLRALYIIASAIIAGSVVFLFHKYVEMNNFGALFSCLFVFSSVYVASLWKTKVVTPEILALLKKGKSELKEDI
jgi:O-antigen/teichoic acid export membrane protein